MNATALAPSESSTDNLSHQLEAHKLGLLAGQTFSPVSVSLSPLQLTTAQWKVAFVTAKALGKLFVNMANQPNWLHDAILELPKDSLASRLMSALPEQHLIKSRLVNINRHDLMLDVQGNWKLIESNSIAAGMGPFSEKLKNILEDTHTVNAFFAPNPAIQAQANTLFDSASSVRNSLHPNIVFLVEPNEDNIFDQQYLADALRDLGAHVHFKTLRELRSASTENSSFDDSLLHLSDLGVVDGLYFRTGYNLADYGDTEYEQSASIEFRAHLEQKNIALCPTIPHQVATNKWVQMRISDLSIDQLMNHFGLTMQEAIMSQLALATSYQIPESKEQVTQQLSTKEWLWKSQGEGGGNLSINPTDVAKFALPGSFLMKKIVPFPRKLPVERFSQSRHETVDSTVSELGIFTVGPAQTYGGYLLRTKASHALESGVHRGDGMIDTVIIGD